MALGHMTAWTEKGCSTALRHTETRTAKRETQADRWLTVLETTNIVLDRRSAGRLMTVSSFRQTNGQRKTGAWEIPQNIQHSGVSRCISYLTDEGIP